MSEERGAVRACAGREGRGLRRGAWGLAALLPGLVAAAAPDYRIGAAPAWVVPVVDAGAPAPAPGPASVSGGTRWRLVDDQVRIAGAERSSFHRTVKEAVTNAGVDEVAQMEVTFDPSYESLVINDVRVTRAGQAVSRLGNLSVKVLQREKDLESRIYDGRKTVNVVLNDIRPGDIVDTSYTLTGHNPVFGRHQSGGFSMQWGVPVVRLHSRLVEADGVALQLKSVNGAPQPTVTEANGQRELVWDERDVQALHLEVDTPRSFDPYASVEWSDFADWGAVARWAEPLYPVPAHLGPALQAERDRIAAAAVTPQARTAAVLHLVQEQVRYLGVEMGANAHMPSDADTVFARRYGDCKEKALLMVALLRSLGVDASPALVNTERRGEIARDLPSSGEFDHAITRVRIGERTYWLDATRSPQGDDIDRIAQSRYGQALVLDGRSTALTAMPAALPAEHSRDIHVDLDLSGGPVQVPLQIVSTMKGATAEHMRALIEDQGVEALQTKYLNFYADTYDGIRVDAPMEVRDDPHADTLTTIEHYGVDNFWNAGVGPGQLLAKLSVPELEEDFYNPKERIRRMPLNLGEPSLTDVMYVVHGVAMPRIDDTRLAAGSAFELERAVHAGGNTLAATWHYERSAEQVAPSGMKRYLEDLQKARDIDGYSVRAARGSTATMQDWMIGAFVMVLLALFVRIWWRHQMRAAQAQARHPAHAELPIRAHEVPAAAGLEPRATAQGPMAAADPRVAATPVQRLILAGWALVGAVFTVAAAAGGREFLGLSDNEASPLLWAAVVLVGSTLTWQWTRAALRGRVAPPRGRTRLDWIRFGASWLISAVGFVCFAHATLGGALWGAVVVLMPVDVAYSGWLSRRQANEPSGDALADGA
jgi:transglutaminase-like putative cysteine protease